jgi:predicted GNAT superfamily acetyltransferase
LSDLSFRVCKPEDFPELVRLNESCVPHVNSIGTDMMLHFLQQAFYFRLVHDRDDNLAGFVIALQPGCDYQSVNYQWFQREFSSFLYIDRIMVHPSFRRRGVAGLIYKELEQVARSRNIGKLCCEVNIRPPNPESRALHHQLGFLSAGTQTTDQGAKEVDLLVKDLHA